ncbi:MAG: ShlB/FhaC/HecB family hemolysin secretion/activation protein [Leptolyngbyaceae cyanobacterium MO_188.B28]|nr:ShlB/FhaC/HecB family hemolysin secretion/activation protein [Leptolyngbyaceae cyanobacterium MO_188.B28]
MNCPQSACWIYLGAAVLTCSFASSVYAATLDEYPDHFLSPTIAQTREITANPVGDFTEPRLSLASADISAAPAPKPLPEAVAEQAATVVPRNGRSAALENRVRLAQVTAPINIGPVDTAPIDTERIPLEPEPEPEPLPTLPPPEDLLDPSAPAVPSPTDDPSLPSGQPTVIIERFEVVGGTVFSEAELAKVTAPFTNRPLTFADVLAVRDAITRLYIERGYITSGAIVPPQDFRTGGVAEIRVIEGRLEDIQVIGTQRLRPSYVSSRIGVGASTPLNRESLLEQLQLLQLDPLIDTISADLQTGTQPGANILVVSITEADSFDAAYAFDNNRAPSVGSARHRFELTEANLLGLGDRISLGYAITEGSDQVDFDYTLPLNPRNGTLRLAVSLTDSDVIEDPFDVLEIESESDLYELTLRQPLLRTPTQEFALGLTASHQRSQTSLGIDDIGPFPLSPGADDEGRTRVSALRLFQEWSQRSSEQVIAMRSQFSFGLDVLDATVNDGEPDSRFFTWQGQGQWVRLLGPDALLVLRGGVQVTPDSLLTLERFGLGGQSTVRGYRQDQVLTDNGVLASVEVRLPVLRDRSNDLLLQMVPFIDVGHGWNNGGDNPDTNTLLGVGTGLLLNITEDFTARFDWGIPLISVDSEKDTLQENGLYFSIDLNLF